MVSNYQFTENLNYNLATLTQMHGKESVNTKYLHSWLCLHCPRLVVWLHRSIVHMLTVGYRTIPENKEEEEVSQRCRKNNSNK